VVRETSVGRTAGREFRLFCAALRHACNPQNPETFSSGPLDWAAVVAGSRRHAVAPLLLAGLPRASNPPADVMADLHRQTLLAAKRSLAQVAEIGRLMPAFAEANIRVLVLKGVALSKQLHADAFPRGARDIDLLVDPMQFPRIEPVLAAAGYRSSFATLTSRQRASFRRWIKDIEYLHDTTGAALEVHDRLVDNPSLLHLDFNTLWHDREEVHFGNMLVPTLSRRTLALYLCVHGAGHAWERLRWLVDLVALLRDPDGIDRALADAAAAGLGPAMLHAVMLAQDWLGLAVPSPRLACAHANVQVSRLDLVLRRLYAGSAWHEMPARGSWRGIARYSLWQRLYRLMLKPGWRYRISQIMHEGFSAADLVTVRLPDALFFLYPLVRPVGWLVRRWRQ
jgi:Uncharacterised nucleotidyltransferase